GSKGSGTGSKASSGKPATAAAKGAHPQQGRKLSQQQEKVISPELRRLLSREIVKLDKGAVVASGGGVH
ncbi:MAG: hypothetical protein M1835_004684, partial [Candelina submexicana]